jgi:c-di-GMP-binding flagellar brake protein YcgR
VDQLEPGQRLDLRIATAAGEHALHSYVARHEVAAGRLLVSWPTEGMRLFPLRAGQRLTIELVRPGDALYSMDCQLESASMEEPPMLTLRLLSDWHRVQRREAHRHPIEMRATQATRFSAEGERESFDALIRDLSTGGMRVHSRSELTLGDELELMFGTPSGGAQLRLRVHVLRVVPRDAGWDAGCQFVESSLGEREQIVHFILAQQNAIERAAG